MENTMIQRGNNLESMIPNPNYISSNVIPKESLIHNVNFGCLATDKPKTIIKAELINMKDKELKCLVEWCPRYNGFVPEKCWISSYHLIEKVPKLMCEFLIKHIKFP